MEQDLRTLSEHLRSQPVFDWVRVAQCLVFYDVFVYYWLSVGSLFLLAMAFSVYHLMSLSDVIVSFQHLIFKKQEANIIDNNTAKKDSVIHL